MWFGTVYRQTTDICYPDICAEGSSKHYTPAWQLHIPLVGDLSSSVTDERVPSNVYLRALFCLLVARPSFPLYILFTELYIGTGMKMSRYILSTPKNKPYYRIPHIFIPTSNHNLPGPGAALAVAARLLWVGLTCQSLRGRLSRLTLLPPTLTM